jgi:hypothetical protein
MHIPPCEMLSIEEIDKSDQDKNLSL